MGQPVYQPRPANDIERIATLVRTAIGYDKDRGDQVEVVNLRFAETPAPVEFTEPSLIQSFLAPSKEDVMRMVELSVLLILTVIVLMAVVRPLLRRVLASEPAQAILMAGPALAGGEPGPGPSPGGTRQPHRPPRRLRAAERQGPGGDRPTGGGHGPRQSERDGRGPAQLDPRQLSGWAMVFETAAHNGEEE